MMIRQRLLLIIAIALSAVIVSCSSGSDAMPENAEPPATPEDFNAVSGDGEIILNWAANSEPGLSHYNVFQRETAGSLAKIDEVPAGMETYTAEGLENGTTYYFALSAENSDGLESEQTGEVSAIPQPAPPARYETTWVNQFGSNSRDGFVYLGLALADDHSIWAVSHFGASFEGVGGPFVARLDAEDGTILSVAALDFPVVPILPHAIALTDDGGYVISGYIQGALPGKTRTGISDVFLAKFDNSGVYEWGFQAGVESNWTEGHAITVAPSGDIYVTGNVSQGASLPGQDASGGGRDVFLMKFNSSGENEWTRQFGNGSDRLWAHGVSVINDDEIVVTGTVADDEAAIPGSDNGGNAFIRRYDPSGDELGTVQLDVPIFTNQSGAMALDSSGDLWVFGSATDPFDFGGDGGRDFVLARINPSSRNTTIAAQFGTSQSEWGDAIVIGPGGEVYAGGSTDGTFTGQTNAGDYDIVIARLEMP